MPPRVPPLRIAQALEYLQGLKSRAGEMLNTAASTPGTLRPDEYQERFGLPGEPVPSLNQIRQSVRGAAQRMTSLDAPASQGMGDTALDIAAGFTPLQYPQAARDFERSRRTGDRLGMALATFAAVPVVGGVAKAVGKADDVVKAYGLSHRPMTEAGGAARLHDAVKTFGEDIFGKNALQYFGSGDPRESAIPKLLAKVRNNPNAEITIYRGVPEGVGDQINSGDWVTLDESVAKDYGEKVLKQKVKARDVTTWPDSLLEFGYYPQK